MTHDLVCRCPNCNQAQEIAALRAENERLSSRLQDLDDDFRRVMAEDCAPDERHCTCVPHLRAELAKVRGEREELAEALRPLAEQDCESWGCSHFPPSSAHAENKDYDEDEECAPLIARRLLRRIFDNSPTKAPPVVDRDALTAQLARYRAALENIRDNFDHEHHSKGSVADGECDGAPQCRCCEARTALEDGK